MNAIGENVRAARVKARLSQEQLAERVSVSRNYITQIETGRKRPAIKLLEAISDAMSTPVSALLDGDPFIEKIRQEFYAEAYLVEMAREVVKTK
jgi:transcriptional regulator with XRE-family HTH domain